MDNKIFNNVIKEMEREIQENRKVLETLQHEHKEKVENLKRLKNEMGLLK